MHLAYATDDDERSALIANTTYCDFVDTPADAEVIVGSDPALLADAAQLKHWVLPWAGVPDRLRLALLERGGVTLHNLHDNAAAVAEHAVGLLLAACRRLTTIDAMQRRGEWPGRGAPGDVVQRMIVLEGKSAVLLGFGEIGRRVGRILEAMDVRVTAVTRTGRDGTTPIDRLNDVLPRADVLVCSLPLTDATRGLIDARRLALLPAGSVIVNVGRGHVFDESALFAALQTGPLAAAGLDVWWTYPHQLPDGEPSTGGTQPWETLDNVLLSPHVAAAFSSPGRRDQRLSALAHLLQALTQGERPSEVDLHAGY